MKFFISYSRSVKDEVRKVIDLLEASGHEVWWDADIPVLADWWATILSKIEWCEVFIFVSSEKSVQSAYCLAELKYASDKRRPIIPFVLDVLPPDKLPKELPPRGQWLVYDGEPANMLRQINIACDNIDWKQHKNLDIPRPPEPLTGGISLAKQYQLARQLANEGKFEEAKTAFRGIKSIDYGQWGDDCDEWLERIASYLPVAELAADTSTLEKGREAWAKHVRKFGKDFDPLQVDTKLKRVQSKNWQGLTIGITMLIVLAIVGVILIPQLLSNPAGQSPEATTEVVQIASETDNAIVTEALSPSPSPNATELELTLRGEMLAIATEAQETIDANLTLTPVMATVFAQQTSYFENTESANATATATLRTATPTPDIRQTAEARLTLDAATITAEAEINASETQQAINLSNTQAVLNTQSANATNTQVAFNLAATNAELATQTQVSNNATATQAVFVNATMTATHDPEYPLRLALQRASTRMTSNAEWQELYPNGFVWEFDGVPMVLVPAGCFRMGNDSNSYAGTSDGGQQCFDEAFWIDRYEVWQEQFRDLGGQKTNNNYFTGDNRPVEQITWFEARDYCALRNGSLPSEREWEYAARGVDNLYFPWGSEWNENNAVWNRSSSQGTADVGSIPTGASWVGALDLSGNVWEWTRSIYADYPYNADDGREEERGESTDVRYALRGGSWGDDVTYTFRSATRYGFNPLGRYYYVGFRCVLSYNNSDS